MPTARNRRGVIAGFLLLGSFLITALSVAIGLAVASTQTSDTALAWMPLILPSLATIVVVPLLIAATVLAVRGAARERTGRVACIIVAVASGVLALLLAPVALNALFAVLGLLGVFG